MKSDLRYLPDVDRLRAVAITSVVVYHMRPSLLPGGFLGVDLFFVISGFLVTRQFFTIPPTQNAFTTFLARRIKRIFPAVLVVVILVTIALVVIFPYPNRSYPVSAFAALTFWANIFFFRSVDYFDTSAVTQPLLHLWSLGIEEQFYLALPIVILSLRRFPAIRKLPLFLTLAGFSFLFFIVQSDSAAGFYLPHTRAWELLAGSTLATLNFIPPARTVNKPWISRVALLCLVILFLILTRAVSFDEFSQIYPSLFAVSIALAFICISQVRVQGSANTWDPVILLGKLSFSLYLWHYPIFVILRIYASSNTVLTLSLIPIFVLSVVTYKYIESPIRKLKIAEPRSVVSRGILTAILVGLVVFVVGKILLNPESPYDEPSQVMADLQKPAMGHGISLGTVTANQIEEIKSRRVVVVGDSFAEALTSEGGSVSRYSVLLRTDECSLVDYDSSLCEMTLPNLEQALRELNPKTVLIHFRWTDRSDYINALRTLVLAVQENVDRNRIVIVGSVPTWSEVQGLPLPYRVIRNWDDLTWLGSDGYLNQSSSRARLEIQADRELTHLAAQLNVQLILPRNQLCNKSGCLAVTRHDGRASATAWDYGHLTKAGVDSLWRLGLQDLVLAAVTDNR